MLSVKITTTSGHFWATSINGPMSLVTDYFMGQLVNIAPYSEPEVETFERVVDVEEICA